MSNILFKDYVPPVRQRREIPATINNRIDRSLYVVVTRHCDYLSDDSSMLIVNEAYKVKAVEVSRSHSDVILYDYPNKGFNSVMFETLDPEDAELFSVTNIWDTGIKDGTNFYPVSRTFTK